MDRKKLLLIEVAAMLSFMWLPSLVEVISITVVRSLPNQLPATNSLSFFFPASSYYAALDVGKILLLLFTLWAAGDLDREKFAFSPKFDIPMVIVLAAVSAVGATAQSAHAQNFFPPGMQIPATQIALAVLYSAIRSLLTGVLYLFYLLPRLTELFGDPRIGVGIVCALAGLAFLSNGVTYAAEEAIGMFIFAAICALTRRSIALVLVMTLGPCLATWQFAQAINSPPQSSAAQVSLHVDTQKVTL